MDHNGDCEQALVPPWKNISKFLATSGSIYSECYLYIQVRAVSRAEHQVLLQCKAEAAPDCTTSLFARRPLG